MTNVAILGFGVVGGGVADLLTGNAREVSALCADDINIKYILDLRDFPDSPFADRVVHNFDIIAADPDVSVVIEVMGGSHPAYEFTVTALKAGKHVITSNKEVVANYGDEFLRLARENGVSYRFEAAVGGGIPVIAPLISFILHNKISEIRGILNGTTNYILTKMFSFGVSFDKALARAQEKGYAEKNPDADILGIDACRKIAILAAIATGKLVSVDAVYTEGITQVRSEDVLAAERAGYCIKLVGRCVICDGDEPFIMVAPHFVSKSEPLASVNGVYNAVEVIGKPLGNVMFYGKGAGAGATASAVVGDLMQTLRLGEGIAPVFKKCDKCRDFSELVSAHYLVLDNSQKEEIASVFGNVQIIPAEAELAFITERMSEAELSAALESLGVEPVSHIRIL